MKRLALLSLLFAPGSSSAEAVPAATDAAPVTAAVGDWSPSTAVYVDLVSPWFGGEATRGAIFATKNPNPTSPSGSPLVGFSIGVERDLTAGQFLLIDASAYKIGDLSVVTDRMAPGAFLAAVGVGLARTTSDDGEGGYFAAKTYVALSANGRHACNNFGCNAGPGRTRPASLFEAGVGVDVGFRVRFKFVYFGAALGVTLGLGIPWDGETSGTFSVATSGDRLWNAHWGPNSALSLTVGLNPRLIKLGVWF